MKHYPTIKLTSATMDDLTWLTGDWVGDKDGVKIEEQWSPAAGNAMMCMFRWIQADQVRFYEFVVIEQEGESLILRIKHFNPGLIGWEEKEDAVSFSLVQLEGEKAAFYKQDGADPLWLIYERVGEDSLIAYFESGEGGSRPAEDVFSFKLRATHPA